MSLDKNNIFFKGTLQTEQYTYKITITTSQITRNGTNIVFNRYFNIGAYVTNSGEKKTCVDIYVMYPEMKKEIQSVNYKIAKLITTHYNEKCSIDKKLERGEGTKHMINTAMYFVYKMCPFIDGFDINDASTRDCENNTTIVLSYFSITSIGKTWYEKNFKAYIADTAKRNKYHNTVEKLLAQQLPSWDVFEAMFLRGIDNEIIATIKNIYSESNTYQTLFKNIHNLGINKACVYLQPWIEKLMLTTDLRNYILYTQWVIPINSVKQVNLINYKKEFVGRLENYKN
jgi:hypothetical protein